MFRHNHCFGTVDALAHSKFWWADVLAGSMFFVYSMLEELPLLHAFARYSNSAVDVLTLSMFWSNRCLCAVDA